MLDKVIIRGVRNREFMNVNYDMWDHSIGKFEKQNITYGITNKGLTSISKILARFIFYIIGNFK